MADTLDQNGINAGRFGSIILSRDLSVSDDSKHLNQYYPPLWNVETLYSSSLIWKVSRKINPQLCRIGMMEKANAAL